MIEVVDNFLPKDIFKHLEDVLCGKNFPWYYNDHVASPEKTDDLFYFTHMFYNTERGEEVSPTIQLIEPILNMIQPKELIRVKGNLYTTYYEKRQDPFHVDYRYPHRGAIFYLNTNNGYTVFEDGTKVDAVANRIMFFDPTVPHASTRCTDAKIRVNVNFNYYE
jgi:hypothetical protein